MHFYAVFSYILQPTLGSCSDVVFGKAVEDGGLDVSVKFGCSGVNHS